jgi:glucans biosynthesis protein C
MVDRTPARKVRIHYLDTLKVAIVYGILVYHAALPFTFTNWLVSNPQKSVVLTIFVLFCFPWGIPMMFLLSGSDSWFALRRRSAPVFLRARFLRLVLPLAAGIALLSPVQAYITSSRPVTSADGLLGSYSTFFLTMRLAWTPAWLGRYGYHLWFLGYLFAISAVLLPLLELLRRPTGRRAIAAAADLCQRTGMIYLLALPLVVSQVALRERFPAYQDWADIATYSFVFVAGYVLASERRFETAIRGSARLAVLVGVLSSTAIGGFLLAASHNLRATGTLYAVAQPVYAVLWALMVWSWLVAVLYLGIRWLDFGNRVTEYLAESILPFYVLHHPVVVLVATIAIGLDMGVWAKFLLVVAASLAITLTLYELLVRRWAPARMVFGLGRQPAAGTRTPASPAAANGEAAG